MSSPESKARLIGLLRPLKDVTVTAGDTATFDCELSYEGIPVEWFLGGTKLEPSDRVSVHVTLFKFNSHLWFLENFVKNELLLSLFCIH